MLIKCNNYIQLMAVGVNGPDIHPAQRAVEGATNTDYALVPTQLHLKVEVSV